jgi:hypothetical protein
MGMLFCRPQVLCDSLCPLLPLPLSQCKPPGWLVPPLPPPPRPIFGPPLAVPPAVDSDTHRRRTPPAPPPSVRRCPAPARLARRMWLPHCRWAPAGSPPDRRALPRHFVAGVSAPPPRPYMPLASIGLFVPPSRVMLSPSRIRPRSPPA